VSESSSRSRFFSLNLGIFCIGVALGPTLGGKLISYTGDILSVFYMSAAINLSVALVYWLIVPESLPKKSMNDSRMKSKHSGDMRQIGESILSSFSTLLIFAPRKIELPVGNDVESVSTRDTTLRVGQAKTTTDWNMFFLAIGSLLPSMSVVSISLLVRNIDDEHGGCRLHIRLLLNTPDRNSDGDLNRYLLPPTFWKAF
jgi:MFS family permease